MTELLGGLPYCIHGRRGGEKCRLSLTLLLVFTALGQYTGVKFYNTMNNGQFQPLCVFAAAF